MSSKLAEVYPPVVASVAEWHADDGATVEEGDIIAQVESMKTFFPIHAPATGVLRYKVDLGEIVGQEDLIAVIEIAPDA